MATTEELLQQKRDVLAKKRELLEIQRSVMAEQATAPTKLGTFARSFRQGATFGFGDEIEAAFQGAKGAVTTPGRLGQRRDAFGLDFDSSMTDSALRRAENREAFPKTSLAGELTGGGASGGGSFKIMSNSLRNVPLVLRAPGIGAVEGAAFGAGTAEPGERGSGAAFGAGIGGVATPIAAGIGVSAASVLRPVAKRLGESLFGTPRDRAVREVMKALDADDITKNEVVALIRQMGPNAVLADLGDTLARQGRTVTSELGPGASKAKRFLDARQRFSQIRLRQSARRATGANDFDRGIVDIINGAESKAAPLYDEVFSEVLDVTPAMLDFMQRPAMKAARRKAATILKNEGFTTDIVDDVTDVRYMDAIKRALDDQISAASRQGNNNQKRVLTKLKKSFVEELDSQVPKYAEARSVFAGEQAIKDAAEVGRSMFVGKKRVADIAEQINAMGESELQSARAGFLEWLSDELASQSVNRSTVVNKFTDVPKFKQLTSLLFPSEEAVNDFISTASAQSRFAQTRNIVTGGSPTARIQADRNLLSPGVLGFASAADPVSGLAAAMRLIKGNTQLTPEVLEEMGKILFNPKITEGSIRRNIIPGLFDIPKANPVTTAGFFGGLVGSQQDDIFTNLESLGLLGSRR